ncbi:MAG TPA: DUF4389 domain-containing protein [Gallionella sp.]
MNDQTEITQSSRRNVWTRGIFMLLILLAIHVSGTVLFLVTLIQFLLVLLSETPNARLVTFGRSLGRYLQQCVNYLIWASEDKPFPFSDWPSGAGD